MIDDLAGGLLGAVGRFFGWVLVQLVFEILICGTGQLIWGLLGVKLDPDETATAVTGIVFWSIVALLVFGLLTLVHRKVAAVKPRMPKKRSHECSSRVFHAR